MDATNGLKETTRVTAPVASRSDDEAIAGLGGQSVVVDVRVPDAVTHINRV
jgi:hypothetical protein